MENKEDIKLVQLCLRGDVKAQKALYQTHFRRVADTCMRFALNRDTATDLAQEVFIRVFQNIHRFQHQSALSTWIHRIAINICLDHVKKEKRMTMVYDLEEADQDGEDPNGSEFYDVSAKEVMEAMKLLPEGYRMVLTLYVLEGFSHAEIAQELKISEGTSKSQLFKARKFLKQILQPKHI